MHIPLLVMERPITRFRNDTFHALPPREMLVLSFINLSYAAIYVAGWNFWFPSRIESILWRVSTLVVLATVFTAMFIELFVDHLAEKVQSWFRSHCQTGKRSRGTERGAPPNRKPNTLHKFADLLRNNSPDDDPAWTLSLGIVIPLTITAAIYCVVRAYILLEGVVTLRSLPASAYQTVVWTSFIPHLA